MKQIATKRAQQSGVKRAMGIFIVLALAALAATPLDAQATGSITQVSTSPSGLQFFVDDQIYSSAMGAAWPAGSKHTLSIGQPIQYDTLGTTQYTFTGWQWNGQTVQGGAATVTVTADPTISGYQAVFSVAYALSIQFNNCPTSNCVFPGTVYVNGAPTNYDETVFVGVGGSATIQAVPASGYVFVGWENTNAGAVITGYQQTLTINQPTTVYPEFQVARTINFLSSPSGLEILADGELLTTPGSLQWGYNTTNSVSVVTPQQDRVGNLWVWQQWSDNGAANHTYTVAPVANPDTLTATFVPGVQVTLSTVPQGLSLTVDGLSNLPTYNLVWGVGQSHTVTAPAQQTDAQGHIWAFSSWSNSGAATQTITPAASAVGAGIRMVANYTEMAHLTVTNALAGTTLVVNGSPCTSPCDVYPAVNSTVDVATTASVPISPSSRQDFLSWTVNGATGTGTAPGTGDLLVTLGQNPATASANYHLMNYLAAASSPSAGATFSFQPTSPDNYYDSQTSVAVKAIVQAGYQFRAWAGDLSGPAPSGTVNMNMPRSITAMLVPVPFVTAGGVVNGAALTPQTVVAPGSIVSVFGANLSQVTAVGPSNTMVQALGGVTVMVGSEILPLYFVSPAQINFQLPSDITAGPQTLTISSAGEPNATAPFTVSADAPGLFPVVANQVTFGMITHADGSSVSATSPAATGETLTIFGTGFGATSPARPTGFPVPSSPMYALTDPITLTIGGIAVTPTNAYAQPGSIGVDVLQFVLPAGLTSGANSSLSVTVGSVTSNGVQLAIQ